MSIVFVRLGTVIGGLSRDVVMVEVCGSCYGGFLFVVVGNDGSEHSVVAGGVDCCV